MERLLRIADDPRIPLIEATRRIEVLKVRIECALAAEADKAA